LIIEYNKYHLTICIIDNEKKTLEYSGAYNSLYLVRDNELIDCKVDKMPVGIHFGEMLPFSSNVIGLKKGDVIYTSSDGYSDQFGGAENKKFRRKNFKDLLVEIHKEEMPVQKQMLDERIIEWMDGYSQIDDIIVAGIKIN